MGNYGFVKVATASPKLEVANCDYNTQEILNILESVDQSISAIVFPELSLTSYTAQDLFLQRTLIDGALESLNVIKKKSGNYSFVIIVGLPLEIRNKLFNVGVALQKGKILGIVPKTFMPNYNEFYDKRWFSSSKELKETEISLCGQSCVPIGTNLIFSSKDFKFSIEICEDLWTPIPPSSIHCLNGADIIFNLSASPDFVGKHNYRKNLIIQQSARCISGYVYAAAGNCESTTDLVFSGGSVIAENGSLLSESKRFTFDNQVCITDIDVEKLRNDRLRNKSFSDNEYSFLDSVTYKVIEFENNQKSSFVLNRYIESTPFIPNKKDRDMSCNEIFDIQIGGLAKRLLHTRLKNVVLGVSGGLDSTLALLVLVATYDKLSINRKNIIGITMPGFGTTDRTYNNAIGLMKSLGITVEEISIRDSVIQHFKDIEQDVEIHDITYENSQARERTQILMDYANKVNGLVIGTGDLSELALGWCTYNGDHMSMYGVNTGVPKTLVKILVEWIADNKVDEASRDILKDVLNTPVSPELLPAAKDGEILQKTEDAVGPYLLHDFFLYNMLRNSFTPTKIFFLAKLAFKDQYSDVIILKWLKVFYRRFFSQQFKRSCLPDGPKVGSINLSPRGDWRMPSDSSSSLWIKELDRL